LYAALDTTAMDEVEGEERYRGRSLTKNFLTYASKI
jgi:hypothetical protein